MREVPATREVFDGEIYALREQLGSLLTRAEELRTANEFTFRPGSTAEREDAENGLHAGAWGSRPVTSSHNWAITLATFAEANLLSVVDLLRQERAVVLSTEVLGRAALEYLARAAWLSSPLIGARERVCRWQEERLFSAREMAFLDPAKAEKIRTEVVETAKSFDVLRPGSKNRPQSVADRPSSTSAVRELLLGPHGMDPGLGAKLYKLHSGVVHGAIYALLSRIEVAGPGHDPRNYIAGIRVSTLEVNQLLASLIWGHVAAYREITALFGWDDDGWTCESRNAVALATEVLARTPTRRPAP